MGRPGQLVDREISDTGRLSTTVLTMVDSNVDDGRPPVELSDEELRTVQIDLLGRAAEVAAGVASVDLLLESKHANVPVTALASTALRIWRETGVPHEQPPDPPPSKSWKKFRNMVGTAMTETDNRKCSVPGRPFDEVLINTVARTLDTDAKARLSSVFAERRFRQAGSRSQSRHYSSRVHRQDTGRPSDARMDQRRDLEALLTGPVRTVTAATATVTGFGLESGIVNGAIPDYVPRLFDSELQGRIREAVPDGGSIYQEVQHEKWARVCLIRGPSRSGSTRSLLEALRAVQREQPLVADANFLVPQRGNLKPVLDILAANQTGLGRERWYIIFVEHLDRELWSNELGAQTTRFADLQAACWSGLNVAIVASLRWPTPVHPSSTVHRPEDRRLPRQLEDRVIDVSGRLARSEQELAAKTFGTLVARSLLERLPDVLATHDALKDRLDEGYNALGSRQRAIIQALIEGTYTHPGGMTLDRLEMVYSHWWRKLKPERRTPLDFVDALKWMGGESPDGAQTHPDLLAESERGFRIADRVREYARTLLPADEVSASGYVAEEDKDSPDQTTLLLLDGLRAKIRARLQAELKGSRRLEVDLQLATVESSDASLDIPRVGFDRLLDLWVVHRRLAVLGPAGSGKSTSSLVVALSAREPTRESAGVEVVEVFKMGDWFAWQRSHGNVTMTDWMVHWLTTRYRLSGLVGRNKLSSVAARELINGGYLWPIFDGLDEIPGSDARQTALEQIVELGHGTVGRYLITSRPDEYHSLDVPLSGIDQTLVIGVLGLAEVDRSIRSQLSTSPTAWDPFVDQIPTRENLREVFSTPLYLDAALTAYADQPPDTTSELLGLGVEEAKDKIWERLLAADATDSSPQTETHQLAWLAQHTADRSTFGVHELSHFAPHREQRLFRWELEGSLLAAAVIGFICAVVTWFSASQVGGKVVLGAISLGAGLTTGSIGLLTGGWAISRSGDNIRAWSPRPTIGQRQAGAIDGLMFGLVLATAIKGVALLAMPIGGLVALVARGVPSLARLVVLAAVLGCLGFLLGSPQQDVGSYGRAKRTRPLKTLILAGLAFGLLIDVLYLAADTWFATANISKILYLFVPLLVVVSVLSVDAVTRALSRVDQLFDHAHQPADNVFVGSAPNRPLQRSALVGIAFGLAYAVVVGTTALIISRTGSAGPALRIGLATTYAVTAGTGAAIIHGVGPAAYSQLLAKKFGRLGLVPKRLVRSLDDYADSQTVQRAHLRRTGSVYSFRHREFLEHLAASSMSDRDSPGDPTSVGAARFAIVVAVAGVGIFGAAAVSAVTAGPTVVVTSPDYVAEPDSLTRLTARCMANEPNEELRCLNLIEAANDRNEQLTRNGSAQRVQLTARYDNPSVEHYLAEIERLAYDIVLIPQSSLVDLASQSDIYNLDKLLEICRRQDDCNADFQSSIESSVWPITTFGQTRWGVPADIDVQPLFYRKDLLLALGVDPADLERDIRSGRFTFDDMLELSDQAIKAGLVDEGNGWWHRPKDGPFFLTLYLAAGGTLKDPATGSLHMDPAATLLAYEQLKAALDRGVLRENRLDGDWQSWNPQVANGEVLFWSGGSHQWEDWANNFVADRDITVPFFGENTSGYSYLEDNVGAAEFPTMVAGDGAGTVVSHSMVYVIPASIAEPQALEALQILALATTPARLQANAVRTGNLSPAMRSSSSRDQCGNERIRNIQRCHQDRMNALAANAVRFPNDAGYKRWSAAFFCGVSQVESGVSPEQASENARSAFSGHQTCSPGDQ